MAILYVRPSASVQHAVGDGTDARAGDQRCYSAHMLPGMLRHLASASVCQHDSMSARYAGIMFSGISGRTPALITLNMTCIARMAHTGSSQLRPLDSVCMQCDV